MKFHYLLPDEGRRIKNSCAIYVNQEQDTSQIFCSLCGRRILRKIPTTEQNFALMHHNFVDFIEADISDTFLSEKAIDIFLEENIITYHLEDVNIISPIDFTEATKKELRDDGIRLSKIVMDPPKYYLLCVDGQAKLHESCEITSDTCAECGVTSPVFPDMDNRDRFFIIDQQAWDGSDLFKIDLFPAKVMCSERFLEVYQKYNMSGLTFKELQAK